MSSSAARAVVGRRDVEPDRAQRGAALRGGGRDVVDLGRGAYAGRHVVTALGEPQRDFAAEAGARAGDEDAFLCHVLTL